MANKTVNVSFFRSYVNGLLQSGKHSKDFRNGMITVLEHMLHVSGNYKGFSYLTKHEIPTGELPGINTDDNGIVSSDYDQRFINTDDTRRFYF